jgi:hypothetical protein
MAQLLDRLRRQRPSEISRKLRRGWDCTVLKGDTVMHRGKSGEDGLRAALVHQCGELEAIKYGRMDREERCWGG